MSELYLDGGVFRKQFVKLQICSGVAGYGVEAMPVNARENQKELKINNQLVNTKPKA